MRVAQAFYSAAACAVAPLVGPLLAWHPRMGGGLSARLLGPPRSEGGPCTDVVLHGSSAGDVNGLLALAERLSARGIRVGLSCWTETGWQMARGRAAQLPRARLPLDVPWAMQRWLFARRPRLVVLDSLEIWPNLLRVCRAAGVPVVVVNGRLSERSLRGYRRARWLFGPCFAQLAHVAALSSEDARRFAAAGTDPAKISVHAHSKHARRGRPTWPASARRCKLVLGSIHRQEERPLLGTLVELLERWPQLPVEIAPRYPHRARVILRRLRRLGLAAALLSEQQRRSATARFGAGAALTPQVVVHDRFGALASAYDEALLAFVGGSLCDHGGHNVIEPAARGAFVLTGSRCTHHAREVELLVDVGAARVVGNPKELVVQTCELLGDPARTQRLARAARRVVERLGGAADEVAEQLLVELGRASA